ncbi:hypothetical protein [Streptomyces rochei]|uniref:hypothetical protein n=1 Tax=Streptomyces rochei TaxID=1928 RepID=UPI0036F58B67
MRPVTRIDPNLPVGAYQTYQITRRRDTTVRAVCEQVACQAWRNGWDSVIDERTELGTAQAAYIRTQSRRTFREMRTEQGLTVFRFESGQRCFADHQTVPELYLVRDGDWRGNPTGRKRTHSRAADWVEDFGENQLRLVENQRKG